MRRLDTAFRRDEAWDEFITVTAVLLARRRLSPGARAAVDHPDVRPPSPAHALLQRSRRTAERRATRHVRAPVVRPTQQAPHQPAGRTAASPPEQPRRHRHIPPRPARGRRSGLRPANWPCMWSPATPQPSSCENCSPPASTPAPSHLSTRPTPEPRVPCGHLPVCERCSLSRLTPRVGCGCSRPRHTAARPGRAPGFAGCVTRRRRPACPRAEARLQGRSAHLPMRRRRGP